MRPSVPTPPPAVRSLLESAGGGHPAALWLPTGTKVDVGQWFRRGRLWVGCTDRDLVLLAAGARPFVETAPLGALRRSRYNPVTGEVVLAPARNLRQRTLKLAPLEGRHLLAHIHQEEHTHA